MYFDRLQKERNAYMPLIVVFHGKLDKRMAFYHLILKNVIIMFNNFNS